MTDTIFALSSGAGRAGVAVFRVSGPKAGNVAARLTGRTSLKARRTHLVSVRRLSDGAPVDRGLLLWFEGPASFTGEDVAEFHVHGGRAVCDAMADALAETGARPAEPGEFTERAFRNGKIDLARAEGLADLIDADTEAQRAQALRQMDGGLSDLAEGWRARLIRVSAFLEAEIDFPDEEDVPLEIASKALPEINMLREELATFLDDGSRAEKLREGVRLALIGAPNAGKSSLLNAVLGRSAAIVSETPGTTRDIVEATLDMKGVPATLADTAGLRLSPDNDIEKEGMRRAALRAEDADIRIAVSDVTAGRDGTAPFEAYLKDGDFVILNKCDLVETSSDAVEASAYQSEGAAGRLNIFRLSAKTAEGLQDFLDALTEAVGERFGLTEAPGVTRARHRYAVAAAIDALDRAAVSTEHGAELAAEDVRLAAREMGRISGRVDVEDVLDEIFSAFCIGK